MNSLRSLLCLLLLAAVPVIAQSEALPPGSRFVELAALLGKAPPPMPTDFARAALQEMIRAYAGEAELARRDRRARARNPGLPRWSRSVESYTRHLEGIYAGLRDESEIAIAVGPTGQVVLYLDSGPVVVSGPRISEPLVLETGILDRFCARHPCDALLAMHQPVQAPPPHQPPKRRPVLPVSVSWVFGAGSGPRCRGDGGLELHFRDSRELVRKRRLCTRVVRELNELAAALESHHSRGVQIQWDVLRVQPLDGEVADLVRLNRDGEQLRVALPTLAAAPVIVAGAREWLAGRAGGESPSWVLRDADRYLGIAGL
jgi:hypothetical protein